MSAEVFYDPPPISVEARLAITKYERDLYQSLVAPVLVAAGWEWDQSPHVAVRLLLEELESFRATERAQP